MVVADITGLAVEAGFGLVRSLDSQRAGVLT